MSTHLLLRRALEAVHHLEDAQPPWTDILDSARRLFGAESACAMTFDGAALLDMQAIHIDTTAASDYADHFHTQDIGLPVAMRCTSGTWLNTEELLPARELQRNPYYVDYMCRHRMRQVMCFITAQQPELRHGFSLQFERVTYGIHHRPLHESAHTFTRALEERLARRQQAAQSWLQSADAAFASLDEGMGLATAQGLVLWASERARALLDEAHGPRLRASRFWHPLPRWRAALASAFVRAAAGRSISLSLPHKAEGTVRLDTAPADPRLSLGTEPLVFWRLHRAHAGTAGQNRTEALCLAFDITPGEARVLSALMDGHSPQEHALRHGRSIHTVRTQIAALMAKMDCSRQVDLVRKALHWVS